MVNIANYQRNAKQNHNQVSPHICQNGYHQKDYNVVKSETNKLLVGDIVIFVQILLKYSMQISHKKLIIVLS